MADSGCVLVRPKRVFFDKLIELSNETNLPEECVQYIKEYKSWRRNRSHHPYPQVTVAQLKNVYHQLRGGKNNTYFYELLMDAEILFPVTEPVPRNPELENRIRQLKAQQEEREYRRMIKDVDLERRREKTTMDLSKDMKAINSQLIAVVNFVVTVGGSFAFGYKMVEYALPSPLVPAQVLVGILLGTIVALAELYFLAQQIEE